MGLLIQGYTYNANGNLTGISQGSMSVATYSYDAFNNRASQTANVYFTGMELYWLEQWANTSPMKFWY